MSPSDDLLSRARAPDPRQRGEIGARQRVARGPVLMIRVLGVVVLLVVALAFTPIPNQILASLLPAGPSGPADAIVVLGAGVNEEGVLTPTSLVRLVRGLTLYQQGLAPIVVLTGSPEEAQARTDLAVGLGIPAAVLRPASGATTREEAHVVRAMLPVAESRIILVTTGAHLWRAGALFTQVGFMVDPAPADFISPSDRKPEVRLLLVRGLGQELAARLYHLLAGYL